MSNKALAATIIYLIPVYDLPRKMPFLKRIIREIKKTGIPSLVVFIVNPFKKEYINLLETLESEARTASNIRLYILKVKKAVGYSGALWLGYRFTNTLSAELRKHAKYYCIMNDDVVPSASFIVKAVSILSKFPKIGGVQGILLYPNGDVNTSGYIILTPLLGLIHVTPHAKGLENLHHYIKYKYTRTYLSGAFALYRAEALHKLGDPFIPGTDYGDDILLGLRLWHHGYYLISLPYIAGIHFEELSMKKGKMKDLLGPMNRLAVYMTFFPVHGMLSFIIEIIVYSLINNKLRLISTFHSLSRKKRFSPKFQQDKKQTRIPTLFLININLVLQITVFHLRRQSKRTSNA